MGCRRAAPPDQLVRVVALPDGSLAVGRTLPGRGAWLCAGSTDCARAAVRRDAFDRALRTTVTSDATGALLEDLAGRGNMGTAAVALAGAGGAPAATPDGRGRTERGAR